MGVFILLCALLTTLHCADSMDTYNFRCDNTHIKHVETQLYQLRNQMAFRSNETNLHLQKSQQTLDQLKKELNQANQQLQQLISSKPIPSNCGEAVQRSTGHQSGVYQLRLPFSDMGPFSAYCLLDPKKNGSAWTVVQRRLDGSTDFYRYWTDYKRGFGNVEREYFIGLELLHAMTQTQRHELWIELEDFEGESRHAKYNSFAIGDETSGYALNVLGDYDGNAGDSLTYHKDGKFSTRDVDNDRGDGNCAEMWTGAWWFNECFYSHLNGRYLHGLHGLNRLYELLEEMKGKGIKWNQWHYSKSLKYVHMAVRPVESN